MKTDIHTRIILFIIFLTIAAGSNSSGSPRLDSTYGHIPLAFTVNEGQAPSSIRFTAQGSGCGMAFSPSGTTFLLSRETSASVARRAAKRSVVFEDDPNKDRPEYESFALKLSFVNANENPEIQGEERLPWNNNYFIGNDPDKWRTDVPNYKKIRFKEVYKGIDLVYYGNQKRVKYDFVVKPGEDPEQILLKYDFGEVGGSLAVNEKGELVVTTPVGNLVEEKPYCYQKISGKEVGVEVKYEVVGGGKYRFIVGEYDGKYDLVIDPEVVYSTYLGGGGEDYIYDIVVDSARCAYVVGQAGMTDIGKSDFPVTTGSYNTSPTSYSDAFVSKINPEGTALIYSTYIGETYQYRRCKIDIDRQGNACITGCTLALSFPNTENTENDPNKGVEAFITKLNSKGNGLVFSKLIGGLNSDVATAIALDEYDNVFITGYTYSPDFPTSQGAYREKNDFGSGNFVFVTKLNSEANIILYSTLIGFGYGIDIKVNSVCEAYIYGQTSNTDPYFPLTDNALDRAPSSSGNDKLFITKIDSTGSRLIYSSLLGGSDSNNSGGMELDNSDCVYLCGYTSSTDFPTTPNAFIRSATIPRHSGFICKLSNDGSKLVYSTLLTGQEFSDTKIKDISIYNDGYAIISGSTNDPFFPSTQNAFQPSLNMIKYRTDDAIVSMISKDGSNLIYSTFWGGTNHDDAEALAIDGNGNVYIGGSTYSKDFPVTIGVIDDSLTNNDTGMGSQQWPDAMIAKFNFIDTAIGVESVKSTPSEFHIKSIYPNPFNISTNIKVFLPESTEIKMSVYSVTGQKVYEANTERLPAGIQIIVWNGKNFSNHNVSTGIYLIQLNIGKHSLYGKALLLK